MNGARVDVGANEAGADLHQAARISRCNPLRFSGANVGQLRRENRVGRIWLNQIVDTRASAALIGVVQRNKLQTRNRRQHREWLLVDPLRVQQMARRIVGDAQW